MQYFVALGYQGKSTVRGVEENTLWVNIGPIPESEIEVTIHSHKNPMLKEVRVYEAQIKSKTHFLLDK